jgi:hypothetical protein
MVSEDSLSPEYEAEKRARVDALLAQVELARTLGVPLYRLGSVSPAGEVPGAARWCCYGDGVRHDSACLFSESR